MLRRDEAEFWHTMTPLRCSVLYREHFALLAPKEQRKQQPPAQGLAAYLMGGG